LSLNYVKEGIVRSNKKQGNGTRRLIQLVTVLAILIVLLGKAFFHSSGSTFFLFTYGITVTGVLFTQFFIGFFIYKDPYFEALKAKALTPEVPYFVSCMVAVKNEEDHIARCLDSMIGQTYSHKEIIVVNDASTDNTLQVLRGYENAGKIVLINLAKNVGKKKALGKAMEVAKGNIFAFTDSDSIWASTSIAKIVKIFEHDSEIGAVSGHTRVLNGNDNLITKTQDTWYECQYSIRKAFESVFNCVTCVSGPIAVFRREAVYNFVPAWENDHFLGQEFKFATDRTLTGFVLGSKSMGPGLKRKYKDSNFVKSVDYPTKDWKIVYCKSAKAWTIVPDTFPKMLKQQIRWKKSFIRNIFFTGGFYWRKPFLPAIIYYLHIMFVLGGPFVAFRHLLYFPLMGNIWSGILYLSGIIFVGSIFGIAFKLEDPTSTKWIYRPLMSLMSTLVFSWLIFYSLLTIRKMTWSRE